jgi:uncharacterized protein (UPF0332 family)
LTTKEKQIQLAKYRLKQAEECIDEANCLFSSKKSHRSINQAYDLRQEGDYREYVELSCEQVEPFIEKAKNFNNKSGINFVAICSKGGIG